VNLLEAVGRSTIAALACALALAGCGGGEVPPVTFVATLATLNQPGLYERLQGQLDALNIRVIKYQCGYDDRAKLPFEQQGLWADGALGLLFFTVAPEDAAAAASIQYPVIEVVTPALLQSNSDPFDCDPAQVFN
jgi:hypothetical protein